MSAPLYFCDNGMLLCEDHLGSSAKATGRDISGQKIQKVTQRDREEWKAEGLKMECEMCEFRRRQGMVG